MTYRRRIWSEFVPLDELADSPVLNTLSSHGIQILAAVQPSTQPQALRLAQRAQDLGLSLGFWPMLDNQQGRWLSTRNASPFTQFVAHLLDQLEAANVQIDTLALDLEPPFEVMRGVLNGDPRASWRLLRQPSQLPALDVIRQRTKEAEIETFAALLPPLVLADDVSQGWQRILGTPIADLNCDQCSPMLYTTLFEGYSSGLIRRIDALALLTAFAHQTKAFDPQASISLGAVGVGALGDERTYRGPKQLAEDVGICRAIGIDDLALFNLGGILQRQPIEAWLHAFLDTEPAPALPEPTWRANTCMQLLRSSGHLFRYLLPKYHR